MKTGVVKSISVCLLTGFAIGFALYLYKKKRHVSEDKDIDLKTSALCQTSSHEVEDQPITVPLETPNQEDQLTAVQSDSYHSVSSEFSISSSSLVTCTSLSTDTSPDEREIYKKKTNVCGVDIEDEEHNSNNIQDFEAQLSSPVVVAHLTHIETWQTSSVVITPTYLFGPEHTENDNKGNVVPEYVDSYQTMSNTYSLYNLINEPNSPFTAWYVSNKKT